MRRRRHHPARERGCASHRSGRRYLSSLLIVIMCDPECDCDEVADRADRSSTREVKPRAAGGASPVSRRKAMSFVLRCLSDSGTIETSPGCQEVQGRGQLRGFLAEPRAEVRTLAGGDHGIGQSRPHVSMIEREDLVGEARECRCLARCQSMSEVRPPTRIPDGRIRT